MGETARCAAGVRTNALHNAGFVMMLMDIAIRFSKNGKMKITDADGNEQVRPILPNHCIRAHTAIALLNKRIGAGAHFLLVI